MLINNGNIASTDPQTTKEDVEKFIGFVRVQQKAKRWNRLFLLIY
jgi:hypothetical protein